MIGTLVRIYERMAKVLGKSCKTSYAQCGEGLVIQFIFERLKISNQTYRYIGAHHPTWLSNTCLLPKWVFRSMFGAGSRRLRCDQVQT